MNRIILIGNGFDLAHGLKTSYKHFIDNYWSEFAKKVYNGGVFTPWKDELVDFKLIGTDIYSSMCSSPPITSYSIFMDLIDRADEDGDLIDVRINNFFKHISQKTCLETWLDIENEYYTILKDFLQESRRYAKLWPTVKNLNDDFCKVKEELKKYLTKVCKQKIEANGQIIKSIEWPLRPSHIAKAKTKREILIREIFDKQLLMSNHPESEVKRLIKEGNKHLENMKIGKTWFLNFNYTNTAKILYKIPEDDIINIHGELNSPSNNPMIFGYGDELDDDYRAIEKTNDNDFLENIKSIRYHYTPNYRKLLDFLEDEPYQVCIMGHSCGNSDRTLLNTIFEHEHCVSVKPFFHQWRDKKTQEVKDDYTNIVMNISRNFNDKQKMRDVVVNRKFCRPLVPLSGKPR
jgi:hypothetical protein